MLCDEAPDSRDEEEVEGDERRNGGESGRLRGLRATKRFYISITSRAERGTRGERTVACMRIHVSIVDDEAGSHAEGVPVASEASAEGAGECLSVVVSVEQQNRFGARSLDPEAIVR
jgi:hypothetical protein